MEIETKKGYEWLESDIELYNLLVEKQSEGDEILGLFNIQFMDDSYIEEDMEEMNRIYIIRDDTRHDGKPASFDGEGYHVLNEIIIRTSNHNFIQAQQLLKTAVKCIDQHIKKSNLIKWTSINSITPKYEKPGKLREYRLELMCYEINEKTLYPVICSKDLRVDLCVQIGIENTDKKWHKVYPYINRTYEQIQLHEREDDEEFKRICESEIRFGGG